MVGMSTAPWKRFRQARSGTVAALMTAGALPLARDERRRTLVIDEIDAFGQPYRWASLAQILACVGQVGLTVDQLATLAGVEWIDAQLAVGRLLRDGYMRRPSMGDAGLLILTDAGREVAASLRCQRHNEAMAALADSSR